MISPYSDVVEGTEGCDDSPRNKSGEATKEVDSAASLDSQVEIITPVKQAQIPLLSLPPKHTPDTKSRPKNVNMSSISPTSRLLASPSWKVEQAREAKLDLLHRQSLEARYRTTHYVEDRAGLWKQRESLSHEMKSIQDKYTELSKQIILIPDLQKGILTPRTTMQETRPPIHNARSRMQEYHDEVVKKRNERRRLVEERREERERIEYEKLRIEEEKAARETVIENRKQRSAEGELRSIEIVTRRKRASSGFDLDRMISPIERAKSCSPSSREKIEITISYPKIIQAKKRLTPIEEDNLRKEKEREERRKVKEGANAKHSTPYKPPPVLFLVKQKSEGSSITPEKKKFVAPLPKKKQQQQQKQNKKKSLSAEEERELAEKRLWEEEHKRRSQELELQMLKEREEEELRLSEQEERFNQMLAKRDHVLQEIVDTERTYVRNLQLLFSKYADPIKERGLFTNDQYVLVFSDLNIIKNLNEDFFHELENCHNHIMQEKGGKRISSPLGSIGQLFKNKAPAFKLYTNYINKYESSISVLEEQTEKSKAFRLFRREVSEQLIRNGSHNTDISSFMILPVQRIPRYRLLLSDVVKHTPEGHIDLDPLKEALSMIEHIAEYCNQKKSESMNSLKVVELAEEFKIPELVQPSRKLVREGRLKNERSRNKNFRVYLFNDLLLIFQSGIINKTIQIPLRSTPNGISISISPKEGTESDELAKCKLEFTAPEENFRKVLICNSEKERDDWVNIFQETVKGFLKRSGSIQSPIKL
jgi:hypothetical protein